MERLTISGGEIAFYEPIYAKCSNKNAPEIQKQIDKNIPFYDMVGYKYKNMTIRKIEDIYKKLAKLEDVLEKYGIENLEEYISALNEARNFAIKEKKTQFKRYIEEVAKREKLEQELAELKQKAIVPKFKIGQKVWWIDIRMNGFNEQRYRIESYLIDSIVITKEQFRYYGDDGLWLGDNELFATKEEAEQKLAEIKGEKDE